MQTGQEFKKTRLAPTPSGFLHLGNVLSFAITAAIAEQSGARLMLRIDDADRERTNKLYVQDIFDTLNYLEIPWHDGPKNLHEYEHEYSQLHRLDLYYNALKELQEREAIFACRCSRTDLLKLNKESIYTGTCVHSNLPLDTLNTSWRLHTDETKRLQVKTIDKGLVDTVLHETMRNFIVKKKDGFPAYQLTSLIDDLHYGIDFIVRGEDLWPSTLAQQYLATTLGLHAFSDVTFYHHPLIMGDDGLKLSKSLGATSVQYFRKQHKKPADIYALIASLLGIDGNIADWQGLVKLLGMQSKGQSNS